MPNEPRKMLNLFEYTLLLLSSKKIHLDEHQNPQNVENIFIALIILIENQLTSDNSQETQS